MRHLSYIFIVFFALTGPLPAGAQDSVLTIPAARSRALAASASLRAARHAVDAARGEERQAGAFANPVISFNREQASDATRRSSQDILAGEQWLDMPAARSARRSAARARREAAEARLAVAEWHAGAELVQAYAQAIAARRRARLADTLSATFARALAVSEQRLREGDIAGFAARRIRLEAARYAALRAAALRDERAADVALGVLLGTPTAVPTLVEPAAPAVPDMNEDSLVALALDRRADIRSATAEAEALRAEARRAGAERLPGLSLTAGTKRESAEAGATLSGLVLGVALPLPLWDRRGGAVQAARAGEQRQLAELDAARLRARAEVHEALAAWRATRAQLEVLGTAASGDATATLRSAQTAYAEGEITLLEWLDTVRAWHEIESTIATLRADLLAHAAALERAVGVALFQELR